MRFTKAQAEILDALANGEPVYNINQRMRAIRPLIDMGIVEIVENSNGLYDLKLI